MANNSGILQCPEEEIYFIEDDLDEETCDCTEYEIDWEGRATWAMLDFPYPAPAI